MSETRGDVLLDVQGVSLSFGGILALSDVSMQVKSGQVVGIVGPNGAGKSSLLNCINGFYRPQVGRITFTGRDITRSRPHQIAGLGIGRTFQNAELLGNLSVLDNILLGRHAHARRNLLASALYWGPGRRWEGEQIARAEEVLRFLGLQHIRHSTISTLSYGEQKIVEIGRALAGDPRLILYDEPTSGMNRLGKEDVARTIIRVKRNLGVAQVLIEHDMRFIGELCDYLVVLDFGKVLASGVPRDVLNDPLVVEAYLGTGGGELEKRAANIGALAE